MSIHMRRELERLTTNLLRLGGRVEEAVQQGTDALLTFDPHLAQQVIVSDKQIDKTEVEVEEECLKILALYQPVAIDLRFVVAILKINNDLERVGDLARNIAKKVLHLSAGEPMQLPDGMPIMVGAVRRMLHESLDSLVGLQVDRARQVCAMDDEVDAMHKANFSWVEKGVMAYPDKAAIFMRLIGVSRNLERIADHATNIAENAIYLADGDIVRHRLPEA